MIDQAEETAGIELALPTASEKPGGVLVKRLLAKLFGWYHAFLVQQIVRFTGSITQAARALGRHVERLEQVTGHAARARDEASRLPVPLPRADADARVVDALRGTHGRVLVGECGQGDLLAALRGADLDAYGVEPRLAAADAATARGLEVRTDEVATHLRSVATGDLAGAVLAGVVDRTAPGELFELVDLVTDRLAPGATLVVCSEGPARAARGSDAVATDLAPGRPVHPETWTYLLDDHGFETVAVHEQPPAFDAVPGDGVAVKTMNDNLARLYGPGAYVLVARSARVSS